MNQNKPSANPSTVSSAAVVPTAKPSAEAPASGAFQAASAAKTFVLDAFWATDKGRARDHNEDAIGGTPLDYPAAATRGHLFIVADGMGGHNAGEVASSEAAKRVYQRYYTDGESNVFRSLERIIRAANNELYQQAQANPAQRGMGTTMTAFVIKDNHLTAAHVGDSRLYLIRGGKIEQVTHDHSWVEEQVRAGVLTRLQAETHPQRNVITRALATAPDVRVDQFELDLQAGDILVFCSDGLNTEVSDPQIAALATKAISAKEAVDRLIQLANENGGEDNISVGVIRVLEAAAAPVAAAETAVPVVAAAPRKAPILPIIGGMILLVGIIGGVIAFGGRFLGAAGPGRVELPRTTAAVPIVPTATPNAAVAGPTTGPAQPVAIELITQTVATPTTAAAGQPTSTLQPTATPARLVATATAQRPPTKQPTTPPPPTSLAPSRRVAPPVLGDPNGSTEHRSEITFKWSSGGYQLGPEDGYAVLVWQENDTQYQGKTGLDLPAIHNACDSPHQDTSLVNGFAVNHDPGTYLWTVVVVNTRQKDAHGRCVVISEEPKPNRFTYEVSAPVAAPTPAPP